jgi:hypothetical protein
LGHCVATNTSDWCLPHVYTTDTSGCLLYEAGCPPYDYKVVGAVDCVKDDDCQGYDPATHTKYVCECPNQNSCSITGDSYTCVAVNCTSDNECQGYDPATHTKYVCECPNQNSCSITGDSYTCKPKPSCKYNSECDSGWCCNVDPALPTDCKQPTGSCVAKGEIMCNSKYICDPPEGFVSSSNKKTNTQANKKLTLLDLLTNPFYYFFIR